MGLPHSCRPCEAARKLAHRSWWCLPSLIANRPVAESYRDTGRSLLVNGTSPNRARRVIVRGWAFYLTTHLPFEACYSAHHLGRCGAALVRHGQLLSLGERVTAPFRRRVGR